MQTCWMEAVVEALEMRRWSSYCFSVELGWTGQMGRQVVQLVDVEWLQRPLVDHMEKNIHLSPCQRNFELNSEWKGVQVRVDHSLRSWEMEWA